eukprot:TRINITY_DN3293_c0_g1_i1.p1 TRINITY_DN3293_c0_g1~~TRINITY_DN3293_c0_g1_i1.p1  ORF type:complete len:313 (-),score=51.37 TRINITY_DN3293_c0_g1_i1:202-1056(-)
MSDFLDGLSDTEIDSMIVKGSMWINQGTQSVNTKILQNWSLSTPFLALKRAAHPKSDKSVGTVVLLNVFPPSCESQGDVIVASLPQLWDPNKVNLAKIMKQAIVLAHSSEDNSSPSSEIKHEGEVSFVESPSFTLSEEGCRISLSASSYRTARLNFYMTKNSGTHTFKLRIDQVRSRFLGIGVAAENYSQWNTWHACDRLSWGWFYGTDLWHGGSKIQDYPSDGGSRSHWAAGDVIDVVVNMQQLTVSMHEMDISLEGVPKYCGFCCTCCEYFCIWGCCDAYVL